MTAQTASGSLTLTQAACGTLTARTQSGDLRLTGVVADDVLSAQTASGSIRLDGCDAAALSLRTTSGNVTGSLLSDKVFLAESASGMVDIPRTVTGGPCEIVTSSGNIQLTIQ